MDKSNSKQLVTQSPGHRSAQARFAAYVLHSQSDSVANSSAAREAFLSRFERTVDPEGKLDPAERKRRAEHAKKAYFTHLGILSGKARRNAARKGSSS